MPISITSLPSRLVPAALAQRLAQPHPAWGVAGGAVLAMAVAGSAHLLPVLQGAWQAALASLVSALGKQVVVGASAGGHGLAAWAITAGVLVAAALLLLQPRRLLAVTLAGSIAIVALALGWQLSSAIAIDPVLPLAVLLGGIGGRIAFTRWEQVAGWRQAESQRQFRLAVSREKADFLTELTREMRTPVNGVVGVADLLTETALDGEQRRHLQIFRRSAEALTTLLEDLADLARIEAGRVELRPTAIALAPMLHQQIAQVRDEADAKGLQIQLTLSNELPRVVSGDAARLEQALSHLLSHSVKVTRQGRIAIEVRRHARSGDLLRFVITDTSLSPVTGTLAGILEPFSSAGADRSRRHSGIGLALVRALAGVLGGRLSIRHSPGRGTTTVFSALLPAVLEPDAAPAAAENGGASPPAPQAQRAVTSVLLVDDNVSTRELIGSMLDPQRYSVLRCSNGRDALRALEVAPYDVVLMDLNMPELDGWAALRILRRQESERNLRRTPVIALGTAPLELERQRCLEAGFDDHLCKPVQKSRLLESIERSSRAARTSPSIAGGGADGLRPEQKDALELLATDGLIDVHTAVESLGGDASLYLDAIEHLVPALVNWPTRFQESLNRGEFERARQMAQDMQSILDVVAAAPCAASLGRMADALASPADLARHAEALADLDRHLPPLMRTLQQAVERLRVAREERLRNTQGHNSAF